MALNGNAGLIFRVQNVSSINDNGNYYYVGIEPINNILSFGRANNTWNELDYANINGSYQEGIFYRLKIEAINNIFKIYLNEKLYIYYTDTYTNYLSFGSIGIRNFRASTISKSLFVSPNTYKMPTSNPTTDPTINPTVNPTINPSSNSRYIPTIYPTFIPLYSVI